MSNRADPHPIGAPRRADGEQPLEPCVLIAAGPPLAACAVASAAGLEPRVLLTKRQCTGRIGPIRRRARRAGARLVVIHSADWSREPLPQLLELTAARLGARECVVLEDDATTSARLGRGALAARVGVIPFEALAAAAIVAGELGLLLGGELGFLLLGERFRRPRLAAQPGGGRPALLAIWPSGAHVGGSVTHMSGVLAGFRAQGFRIGLVALAPPPDQIRALVDDLEVAPALSRPARLSAETTAICSSRAGLSAGRRLLTRLAPTLVYQRHEAFLTCGIALARRAGAPLVLEWNNSEVWARRHWHAAHPVKRAFDPLAAALERLVLERADLVAAVSRRSASMALTGGADPGRVEVIPNAVDFATIDRALREARHPDTVRAAGPKPATVGWVGSFFEWHGAEVLVRALADLPAHVHCVMVGDGPARAACRALAEELGVAARIDWTGRLPHGEALRRLAACDVLASPHVQTPGYPFFGSPTKIFEYMALGRPIVASALEQIAEVLEHDRTAVLVRPGDHRELAAAIRRILEMPDQGRTLGLAARREAKRSHTWEARVARLIQALWSARDDAEGRSAPEASDAAVSASRGLARPSDRRYPDA